MNRQIRACFELKTLYETNVRIYPLKMFHIYYHKFLLDFESSEFLENMSDGHKWHEYVCTFLHTYATPKCICRSVNSYFGAKCHHVFGLGAGSSYLSADRQADWTHIWQYTYVYAYIEKEYRDSSHPLFEGRSKCKTNWINSTPHLTCN